MGKKALSSSVVNVSRGLFKVHRCEFPHCMKDFRTGESFATIRSRKINFNLGFSHSLVEIFIETGMYGKKVEGDEGFYAVVEVVE